MTYLLIALFFGVIAAAIWEVVYFCKNTGDDE